MPPVTCRCTRHCHPDKIKGFLCGYTRIQLLKYLHAAECLFVHDPAIMKVFTLFTSFLGGGGQECKWGLSDNWRSLKNKILVMNKQIKEWWSEQMSKRVFERVLFGGRLIVVERRKDVGGSWTEGMWDQVWPPCLCEHGCYQSSTINIASRINLLPACRMKYLVRPIPFAAGNKIECVCTARNWARKKGNPPPSHSHPYPPKKNKLCAFVFARVCLWMCERGKKRINFGIICLIFSDWIH